MSRPNYRVHLSYDSERKVFIARIPELPPCTGEGATRSEALSNMERELDALLSNLSEKGTHPPAAIDDQAYSGELSLKLGQSLQRELAYMARVEGVESNQLAAELLAGALERRLEQQKAGRSPRRAGFNDNVGNEAPRHGERDNRPPRNDRDNENRFRSDRGGRNTAARVHGLLEDRASFMEYVRGLENEAGYGSAGHGPARGPRPSYAPHQDRGGRRPPRDKDRGQGQGGRPPGQGPGPRRDGGPSGSTPPA